MFISLFTPLIIKKLPLQVQCGVFKNLKFKNGVDTVIIKAIYREMVASTPGGTLFKTLEKEKKFKSKMFTYDIGLQTEDCPEIVYAPSSVKKTDILKNADLGEVFYFTCVVFENKAWEYKGVPFFVIIDAKRL